MQNAHVATIPQSGKQHPRGPSLNSLSLNEPLTKIKCFLKIYGKLLFQLFVFHLFIEKKISAKHKSYQKGDHDAQDRNPSHRKKGCMHAVEGDRG